MSNQTATAYPLAWPVGWKRTERRARMRARFNRKENETRYREDGTRWSVTHTKDVSVFEALSRLRLELDRLNAHSVVVSSNVKTRLDGFPMSNQREPEDSGVAVYFQLNKKDRVLACDRWDRVADNIVAIAKHIEAVRGQDRWGVGTLDQAFAGYAALPPGNPNERFWWEVLGVAPTASTDEIKDAYREKSKRLHPDMAGGDADAMKELNSARAKALGNL